ncbi:hypothetical protein [Pedobacter miscanthi]|uniref:hypothetical protein n=1 Tax=Pedobacter miscanthi TaxID=2259170 RepID=UPI00292D2DE9|nr:hypothetical protein [Pedobacter miscanthi]
MESRNPAYQLMQSCFPYSFNGTAKSVRELHQLSCNQVYLAEAEQNNRLNLSPIVRMPFLSEYFLLLEF